MKRPATGSTPKQYAYATMRLTGQGGSKKEIARKAGFSHSVAKNAKYKIEETEGYQNAVIALAAQSNNLLLGILAEFKARGMKNFSNKDLIASLNAMTSAWEKIEKKRETAKMKTPEGNSLRAVFTKRVETQTVRFEKEKKEKKDKISKEEKATAREAEVVGPVDGIDMDF